MKLKVIKPFIDKYLDVLYVRDMVIEKEEKRANELIKAKVVEPITESIETKKTKTSKKENNL